MRHSCLKSALNILLTVIFLPFQGHSFTSVDETTLEVTKSKEQSMNAIFDHLTSCNIVVESMRNKSNRLEELFMELMVKNERKFDIIRRNRQKRNHPDFSYLDTDTGTSGYHIKPLFYYFRQFHRFPVARD